LIWKLVPFSSRCRRPGSGEAGKTRRASRGGAGGVAHQVALPASPARRIASFASASASHEGEMAEAARRPAEQRLAQRRGGETVA
jgi:hypothetical protein